MRTVAGEQICAILRSHRGRDNAISAEEIAAELAGIRMNERQVRRVIAGESALWPDLICSAPNGYFVATDYEEALCYHNWLTELRDAAEMKLSAFRQACAAHGIHVSHPIHLHAHD